MVGNIIQIYIQIFEIEVLVLNEYSLQVLWYNLNLVNSIYVNTFN